MANWPTTNWYTAEPYSESYWSSNFYEDHGRAERYLNDLMFGRPAPRLTEEFLTQHFTSFYSSYPGGMVGLPRRNRFHEWAAEMKEVAS